VIHFNSEALKLAGGIENPQAFCICSEPLPETFHGLALEVTGHISSLAPAFFADLPRFSYCRDCLLLRVDQSHFAP
jgi:hypothetical protein